ncbi:hypothetical protein [Acinetobacter sp. MD2(2019)]|uniref:hypothetical protein n=1 Tax=Acinetobacter sp. MD2(2019) TaxID=2605273 RepID=UPI002D7931C9|nr:hypothetical protein [Acinetobacter sp. MD2(2019)]
MLHQAQWIPHNGLNIPDYVFKSIQTAAQIENGKLPVMDKRASMYLNQDYAVFLHTLIWLRSYRVELHTFELNPYWAVMLETVSFYAYGDPQYLIQNASLIYDQLKRQFIMRRTALEHLNFIAPISNGVKQQKAMFKRYIDKYKQMNCIYFELPYLFNLQPTALSESVLPKIARKWLEKLNQAEGLKDKLSDVQWRIVKLLNGIYVVQAIFYIIGEEDEYFQSILSAWMSACICNGYEWMSNAQCAFIQKYCYFADQDMRSFWRSFLERHAEIYKIYRYEREHISYVWKSYTGNITIKK